MPFCAFWSSAVSAVRLGSEFCDSSRLELYAAVSAAYRVERDCTYIGLPLHCEQIRNSFKRENTTLNVSFSAECPKNVLFLGESGLKKVKNA